MDVESLRAAVEAAPDDVKAFESLQNALIEEDRLSELEALYPTVFEAVRDTPAHDRMVRVVDQRASGTEDEGLAAVKYLLTLGADINAVDKNGETCMHGAAYASWPEMVRFLVAHGADIKVWNQKNQYGWTPLLIAEGHRPGNFKPAARTINAMREVMLRSGVKPPKPTPRKRTNDEYSGKKQAAGP